MGIKAALPFTVFVTFLLCGCDVGGKMIGANEVAVPFQITTDFNITSTDWLYGYSDYSPDTKPNDVVVEPRQLPQPFTGYGLYTSGTNRSDDLFIYIKKKFVGFVPNTQYSLTFSVRFLTDAPAGCMGVGGPPGEGVTVKGGASSIEPLTVLVSNEYQMNIDKGNQSNGGKQALALGNIANSNTNCNSRRYESKTLSSSTTLTAKSDENGSMWLLFGIDSGFEAASNIYYQSVIVTASPTDS